jgi:hypothetical protein
MGVGKILCAPGRTGGGGGRDVSVAICQGLFYLAKKGAGEGEGNRYIECKQMAAVTSRAGFGGKGFFASRRDVRRLQR